MSESAAAPPGAVEAILALGTNLGDRLGNLRGALTLLAERDITIAGASSVWETAPVPPDQPGFLNAAVAVLTSLEPLPLLSACKEVEYLLGRRPLRRWGPRPIDIDILFIGDHRIDTPELTVPHVEIAGRPFVLAPLSEVCPGPLPLIGRTALELLADCAPSGIRRAPVRLLLE